MTSAFITKLKMVEEHKYHQMKCLELNKKIRYKIYTLNDKVKAKPVETPEEKAEKEQMINNIFIIRIILCKMIYIINRCCSWFIN